LSDSTQSRITLTMATRGAPILIGHGRGRMAGDPAQSL